MIAGPAALIIALLLIPGWLYWKIEGSPRTPRSVLAESFEIVIASALSMGTATLVYLAAHRYQLLPLVYPSQRQITSRGAVDPWALAWSFTALLLFGSLLAAAGAWTVRWRRRRHRGDASTYHPATTLWTSAFGAQAGQAVTVDVRGGYRFTGFIAGYETAEGSVPSVLLAGPVTCDNSLIREASGNSKSAAKQDDTSSGALVFRDHNLVVPGAEIVAVWIAASE